jgi:flagellar basal body rod protein FlgC
MKKIVLSIAIISIFTLNSMALETANKSHIIISDNFAVEDTVKPAKQDTTDINFKNKKIRITEDEEGTKIEVKRKEKKADSDIEWEDMDDDDGAFEFDFDDDEPGFDAHWAGFEFGLNNFLNKDYKMQMPDGMEFMELNTGKSWNINLNLIEYDHHLIGKNFGIATGMGLEFNDYRFDNLLPVKKTDDGIAPDLQYDNPDYNVEKAKLTTTYITVPLLLELQGPFTKDNDKMYISAGVIGGLKIGSHTKVKYKDVDGDDKKDKNRSDFHLSPFRYGYTVRAGIGFVKLFANYYATPLFEKEVDTEIHPFAAGFVLSF